MKFLKYNFTKTSPQNSSYARDITLCGYIQVVFCFVFFCFVFFFFNEKKGLIWLISIIALTHHCGFRFTWHLPHLSVAPIASQHAVRWSQIDDRRLDTCLAVFLFVFTEIRYELYLTRRVRLECLLPLATICVRSQVGQNRGNEPERNL